MGADVLRISLNPAHPTAFPEEDIEVFIGLSPAGDDDVTPPSDIWRRVAVEARGPAGERVHFAPFGEDPPLSDDFVVMGGAEVERGFSLRRRLPAGAAGRWSLRATLGEGGAAVAEASGKVWVHAVAQSLANTARPVDADAVFPLRHWSLSVTPQETALRSRELMAPGNDPREPWLFGVPSRAAVFPGSARGLVASRDVTSDGRRERAWAAWWTDHAVGVAAPRSQPLSTLFSIDDGVRRVLPGVLPCDDGGCDLVYVSGDGTSCAWVRIGAPGPVTPSADETLVDLERTTVTVEGGGDDGDDDPPWALGSPAVMRQETFGWVITHGAVARRHGGEGIALLIAGEHHDSVEVVFAVYDDAGHPSGWFAQRIEGARLIPGADPTLAVDGHGRARVTLLHTDREGTTIVRTRLAFGVDGTPLIIDGVGPRRLGRARRPCVEGALVDMDSAEPWTDAWAVLSDEMTLIAGVDDVVATECFASDGLLRPLCIVADRWNVAALTAADDGAMLTLPLYRST